MAVTVGKLIERLKAPLQLEQLGGNGGHEREIENPEERKALQERVLRERNGYARPNEIVYRIDGALPDSSAR